MVRSLGYLVAVLTAVAVLGAGCGDDDDTDATAVAEFCDAYFGVDAAFANSPESDDPDVMASFLTEEVMPIVQEVRDTAPDEVADEAETMASAVDQLAETGDFGVFESDEFAAAEAAVDSYTFDNCVGESLSVTAVDYDFEGVPQTMAAGPTMIKLSNDGAEFHEIAVIRRLPGTTESLEELFALPEEEAFSKVEFAGAVFAEPGSEDVTRLDLEAGEYIFACFIPTGSVGDNEGDGPPHFAEGMVRELTIE